MSRPVAVILNDTSTRYHHGCSRVMRLLITGLEATGFSIGRRVPARADWTRDKAALADMARAQVIVINGEGTMHDGAIAADRLLDAVDAAPHVPVALVNTLWEDNPENWSDRLGRMALVAARDSRSAAEMARLTGREVRWLPDLSLSEPMAPSSMKRAGIIVGDSVRADARRALGEAAQRLDGLSLPTKTLQGRIWEIPALRRLLWRSYHGIWSGQVPRFEMAPGESEYLARISTAETHLTGRFHAVCLSMLTATPFLALASRTSKIQTLLADANLGQSRIINRSDLAGLALEDAIRPFTSEETKAIGAFVAKAQSGANELWSDVRKLAG